MKHKNILQILENQIDKIVLGVYVFISLILLWLYVIGNPYGQKIQVRGREKKVGPSQIDINIKQEVDNAIPELDELADPLPSVPSYFSDYDRLVQCSISDISSSVKIPYPGAGEVVMQEDRLYALPEIPALNEIQTGTLRGAAQIPTEDIGPDRPYESAVRETADLDLITISARFDVQRLYNNFQQSFMGPRLKTSWKDSSLATPVFARLDLQRRTKQQDGHWGSWEVVKRTKIDTYHKLLSELPYTLDTSQFGIEVWMSQFKNQKVQFDILQPESYSFTVSRLEWMPPEYLNEAEDILEKEEAQAQRKQLEERQRQREQAARTTDTRRATTRRTQPRQPRTQRRDERTTRQGLGYQDARTTRTASRRERTVEDVRKDFEEELLDEKKEIFSLQNPVLLWAHDDTVEPGQTYQYRIRIGVFNPIAGKDWLTSEQAEYKDQIVLWSDYSEPTPELDIPRRIYMFPMEVVAAKETPAEADGVKVAVAKYHLGRWRDHEFDVYPGEIIGHEVEDTEKKTSDREMLGNYEMMMPGMNQDQDIVDFTTGIILVDVFKEIVWGSRLRPFELDSVLFHDSGDHMQRMPVGKSNWPSEVRSQYAMIQDEIKRGAEQRGTGLPMLPGEVGPEMMMDPMMMEQMMMRGPGGG